MGEVGGGRWGVRFGAVPNVAVRFDTILGESIVETAMIKHSRDVLGGHSCSERCENDQPCKHEF